MAAKTHIKARMKRIFHHPWHGYRIICGVSTCPRVLGFARWKSEEEHLRVEEHNENLSEDAKQATKAVSKLFAQGPGWCLMNFRAGYSDYGGGPYREIDAEQVGVSDRRTTKLMKLIRQNLNELRAGTADMAVVEARMRQVTEYLEREQYKVATPLFPRLPVSLRCPCKNAIVQQVEAPPVPE